MWKKVKSRYAVLIHKGAYMVHGVSYTALAIDAHHAYVIMAGPVAFLAFCEFFLEHGE